MFVRVPAKPPVNGSEVATQLRILQLSKARD